MIGDSADQLRAVDNLRKRCSFSPESQKRFASISGDWNPIHTDAVAARRTSAGRPVVHGMHVVLIALEHTAELFSPLPTVRRLSARFLKPIYVAEEVSLDWSKDSDNVTVRARIAGVTAAELRLHLDSSQISQEQFQVFPHDDRGACQELSLDEMTGRFGTVRPAASSDTLKQQYPGTAKWLGVNQVAGLLCLSRLVGMECPGLQSLFSALDIEFGIGNTSPVLAYKVESVDHRFRRLKIAIDGLGLQGRIEAFARHPSTSQPSMQELSRVVGPREFQGQRALIVGGSRGLGELTAKILAAGGGVPVITYAAGKEDAERVVKEISNSGGRCECLKYDIASPAEVQLARLASPVAAAYYFASCQIFRRRTEAFNPELLDEFLAFYVHGFYQLCTALRTVSPAGIAVFYPSSTAVEERPREMTEYAMAKAAGEILCADLNRFCPGIGIQVRRLPRLPTDQTSSLVPVKAADPIETILPIVRELQSFALRSGANR